MSSKEVFLTFQVRISQTLDYLLFQVLVDKDRGGIMASLKLMEYTSQRRQQASSTSPANLTEPDISDEDYFRWRWSLQHFFEEQGMM